ncbi:glycoside hydrolase family 5 protein [Methylobacterium nigriterrae]|uniref:glycoside hydrolase family 5 protein n=1 Tax=Methylobacterium nigriterrae TaxID=3127512 RepID=UPI0030140F9A
MTETNPTTASALRRIAIPAASMAVLLALAAQAGPAAPDPGPAATARSCAAPGRGAVPPGRLQALARGFSLPGWTDQWPPREPDVAMLARLRQLGLSHVRLPVTLEAISDDFGGPAVAARSLGQIDAALATLLRLGYAVSLDMHPAARFQELHRQDPDRALVVLLAAWRRLAGHYAGTPADRVFFEVLNEPVVEREVWARQGPKVVAQIRTIAPGHTLIYGPTFFQRPEALDAITPLEDENIIYAVHFYDPVSFTHQGQSWEANPAPVRQRIPFPSTSADLASAVASLRQRGHAAAADNLAEEYREPWTQERIDAILAGVAAWSARNDRAVIVNEFGVLSFRAAPEARAAWVAAVRGSAERHCLGWTHWEYADGFGFIHRVDGRESLDPTLGPALTGSP